jgi:3-oxoacyl-[acyl-carrier-protein] synthase II
MRSSWVFIRHVREKKVSMLDRRVAITGMGSVTPFGVGVRRFRDSLFKGSSAASLITSFDTSRLPTKFAAPVPLGELELDSLVQNQKSLKTMSRTAKFAVIAADEAVKASGLDMNQVDPYRLGVSIGTGGVGFWDIEHSNQMFQLIVESLDKGNGLRLDPSKVWQNTLEKTNPLTTLKALPNMIAAHIAINHNARGNCQTIATACTSSAQAIGEAYRQIKAGICDVIISGGADSMIHPYGFVGFSGLGVMSKNNGEYRTAARPFDKRRDGFMLGEGAAIFILEELERCKRRGAEPFGEVIGFASSCDAFRLTDEPPQAWGSIEAMKMALADARLDPESVDYVNAHGTGTVMNDKTETFAIKSVFREKARSLPSTKSMIGHLVAAAGAVEFAACALAVIEQILPPTINYESPDEVCDLDYVPNHAREARVNTVLSNSFGFGGQNACLILRKAS